MAIQMRRGDYRNYNPSKAAEGEFLIVETGDPHATDGRAVYMAFTTGNAKRLATYEDMVDNLDSAVSEATASANSSKTLAQSYAKGDTDSRSGETTDNAKYYKEQAGTSATTAESYAKGGTNSRLGEDTDNAYYYMQQANAANTEAQTAARNLIGGTPEGYAQLQADVANSVQQYLDDTTAVNIDAIPINTMGRVRILAQYSPTASEAAFNYECYGSSTRKVLIVTYLSNGRTWFNRYTGSWLGWEEFGVPQVATASATLSVTASTASTNIIRRSANIVTMDLAVIITGDIQSGSYINIGTIPDGFRPPQNTDIYGVCQISTGRFGVFRIQSGGTISVSYSGTTLSGNKYLRANLSWSVV